jgi:hypothetical protein
VAQRLLGFSSTGATRYEFPKKTGLGGLSDMGEAKRVNTTLGELILAVTEEVAPLKADRTTTNALVSYIVQDMFLKGCVRLKKKSHIREIVEMNVAA